MGHRKAAAVEFGKQRLHIAQNGFAGGGITHMADGHMSGQPVNRLAVGEIVGHQPHPPFGMEALAVKRHNARCFLSAMLQGVQTERGNGGGFRMAKDTEYATLLAQPVGVQLQIKTTIHRV